MKKQVLLIATMLMGLTSATALTTIGYTVSNGVDLNTERYRYTEPIVFIERGIEFLIFPDGSFDFNTDFESNISNVYYRANTRRSSVNITYGVPGTVYTSQHFNPRPRGVIVTHDTNGKVRRIGNVFINYDREGRIKRAGSVYMSYQRDYGLLRKVGGLLVNYNRWGEIVHVTGMVNHYNANLNCGVGFGHGGNNYIGFDEIDQYNHDYYYYRKDGKIKKTKKIRT